MTDRIRVGTRRSRLALVQTGQVLARLARAGPDHRFTVVPIVTSGDRDRALGGSPDFTDAIDRALLRGDVDMAVHSAKDLPAELDLGLELAACPRRADPRDCVMSASRGPAPALGHGARVGSSSLRRRAQLLRWRPDVRVVEIRGNVDTRVGLVRSGEVDAVILAVAGVARLGRSSEIRRILPTRIFLPAPAQGALGVVTRRGDSALVKLIRTIDDRGTRECVSAERSFAAFLGGDCQLPLGALATPHARTISLVGEVLSPDGHDRLRMRRQGPAEEAKQVGSKLGEAMRARGALAIVASGRG